MDSTKAVDHESSSTSQVASTTAVDKVFTTYELVEMILGRLPLRDIAQAQRVCRTFRDVITDSMSLRQLAASQPWLLEYGSQGYKVRRYRFSAPYLQQPFHFANAHEFPPSMRLVILRAYECEEDHAEVFFSNTPATDGLAGSPIAPERDAASAQIWRAIPLFPAQLKFITVNYSLNPRMSGRNKTFGPGFTLGDLYKWLVLVQQDVPLELIRSQVARDAA